MDLNHGKIDMKEHYLKSSFRENLIEHLFIGELLKISWSRAEYSLEVSKPEVDASGYDIIAESRLSAYVLYPILRHAHDQKLESHSEPFFFIEKV